MIKKILLISALAVFGVFSLSACSPTTSRGSAATEAIPVVSPTEIILPTEIPPTAFPDPTDAPTVEPTIAPLPDPEPVSDDDVRDLAENACSVCHSFDRVEKAGKDLAGWTATVSRMVGKGAALTPEQEAMVSAYLAQTYP